MEERDYNENELIYMIQQGDEYSLQLLLESYRSKIAMIIRQSCTYQMQMRNQEKDLQQVAAQALYRSIFDYRDSFGIRFSTFSSSVIRNALIDYQRQQYRRDFSMHHDLLALDAPIQKEGSTAMIDQIPSARVEEDGAFQIYIAALKQQEIDLQKRLNSLEYDIYRLRNEGYSYAQIAEKMGVNLKKVENTLAKIRRLFRK